MELNVLVIDDSAYARAALRGMMETIDGVRANVSTAVDGLDGYRQAIKRAPDLIMLDLEMPEMDGYTFLRLMKGSSVPVIVVSGTSSDVGESKALALGASAYIEKPERLTPERLFSIKGEIIEKVRTIRSLNNSGGKRRFKASELSFGPEAVVIGASTGGPRSVSSLIRTLPDKLPCALVVVMHMPPWLTVPFAERLNNQSLLPVRVATDGGTVEKGEVLVAPGGRHISFRRTEGRVCARITAARSAERTVPSIDLAFSSAAVSWGAGLVGAVMTGLGEDGSKGAVNIKEKGGTVLAESRESAVVYCMPEAAAATGAVDHVLSSSDMGEWIAGRFGKESIKLS